MMKKTSMGTAKFLDTLAQERKRWTALATSTEPVNMPRVEQIVHDMYTAARELGLERIVLCKSPVETAIEARIAIQQEDTPIALLDIRAAVRHGEVLGDKATQSERDTIRQHLWGQRQGWGRRLVEDAPWADINREIGNALFQALGFDAPGVMFPHNVNEQHWAAYAQVAFIDKVWGQACLAAECGWWYAFKKVCIVTERPTVIKFDDQDRLHCDHDAAIRYRDGWGAHSWHGVGFPAEWLDGHTLTPRLALEQENIEKRRAACEILGWDHILRMLDARTIDMDPNPQIGELLSVRLPSGRAGAWSPGMGEQGEMFLRVQCGTGRTFALPVPPNMRTAREANAWTYGLAANEYNPEIRT